MLPIVQFVPPKRTVQKNMVRRESYTEIVWAERGKRLQESGGFSPYEGKTGENLGCSG